MPLQVTLITLGNPNRLTGGYLYHRRMAELAPRHDAHLSFMSLPDRPFPLPVLAVSRLLGRIQADVLVLDSIVAAYLSPWLVLHLLELPLVPMLHQPPGGVDHGPLRTALQRALDRLAYTATPRILVASESLRQQLIRQGMDRARLMVVPPGRDVAGRTGPDPGDLRRGRRMALLCVGNWLENKGILDLLEALARLPADAITLHLAGDDRADLKYAALVRQRLMQPDLRDRVVVHGPLTVEDVAAFYQAADVFALPSRYETYGTVYGEAMALGLPVVGYHVGNLPYLVEHGQEGLLVEPGDIQGLARALRRLAEHSELRERLSGNARRRALERPTWEESAGIFFGALRSAVESLPHPRSMRDQDGRDTGE
ncbi:MAG: glycosyltransferase family 4 protein [Chloroflexota bacterium]|nr:glycosyltransferase family 4 protein [Chloroflexota bacterium]